MPLDIVKLHIQSEFELCGFHRIGNTFLQNCVSPVKAVCHQISKTRDSVKIFAICIVKMLSLI